MAQLIQDVSPRTARPTRKVRGLNEPHAAFKGQGVIKMAQLVGKIWRNKAEVIMVFRVDGKYYPATEYNSECFESYLHTGEEFWLSRLENELEIE